jgi:hypothetical protein
LGTEIDANRKVIFLHLPFWAGIAATDLGGCSNEKAAVLASIENRWRQSDIPSSAASEIGKGHVEPARTK